MEALLNDAKDIKWDFEEQENDDDETEELDDRVHDLETKIRLLVDKHAPVKVLKIDPNRMDWITKELTDKINARNNIKKNLMQRGGSSEERKKWRTLMNQINKEVKQANAKLLQKRLEHKTGNSGSHWEGVKAYLGWKSGGSPDLIVTTKGEATQEPHKVANEIQEAFKGKVSEVEQSL